MVESPGSAMGGGEEATHQGRNRSVNSPDGEGLPVSRIFLLPRMIQGDGFPPDLSAICQLLGLEGNYKIGIIQDECGMILNSLTMTAGPLGVG